MRMAMLVTVLLLAPGCVKTDPLALKSGTGGIMGQLIETRDEDDIEYGEVVPIADATIFVERAGAVVAIATTNSTGHFVVKDLAPKGYSVRGGTENHDTGPGVAVTVVAGKYTILDAPIEAHPL